MISKSLVEAVLLASTSDNVKNVIREMIIHLAAGYDYNDKFQSHILEMCVDPKAIVKPNQVDLEYARKHIEKSITNKHEQTIVNVSVGLVDNIACTVRINYTYSEIKGEGEKPSNGDTYIIISFIDNPNILKKVK